MRKRHRVIRHPSTVRLFQDAAGRLMDLRQRHRQMGDYAWLGILLVHFTSDELALLKDYLCPHDYQLLRAAGVRAPHGEQP